MPKLARDLTDRVNHFDFGENWAAYAGSIDEERLRLATESLRRLVGELQGKSFLDIGSGSGLFSAAALRLGASRVYAVDIDENSVATTKRVLTSFSRGARWTAEQASVFDLAPDTIGQFDVVYSWGVLHHTGQMWRAIDCAAAMVAPSGIFAFALYEHTPLCGVWRVEKRLYMHLPAFGQRLIRSAYKLAYRSAMLASGRKPDKGTDPRGMTFDYDVHDWLGGYPYESTHRADVQRHMEALGLQPLVERTCKVHLAGLFGTGCSEYAYRRSSRVTAGRSSAGSKKRHGR